jgi:BarA-like signal transduction histidine kinase
MEQHTTLSPSPQNERKVRKLPKLPDWLSHIPIILCSATITFRLNPVLKDRILERAKQMNVSMTKVILAALYRYLSSPIEQEGEG